VIRKSLRNTRAQRIHRWIVNRNDRDIFVDCELHQIIHVADSLTQDLISTSRRFGVLFGSEEVPVDRLIAGATLFTQIFLQNVPVSGFGQWNYSFPFLIGLQNCAGCPQIV
jgi:hypothetical protein